MDIVLERILSLIPKKPDGKYVHGAKREFARSIGYDGGDIVSMWINGSSKSYMGKLHEIAAVHHVSVEWLQGKTDEKSPPPKKGAGQVPTIQDWKDLLATFSKDELKAVIDMATTELLRRD